MILTKEFQWIGKEAVLVHGQLLYEISPDGLKRTANSLISCEAPGQEKNHKHPYKREVVISKQS